MAKKQEYDSDFIAEHRLEIDTERVRIYKMRKQFCQIDRDDEIFRVAYTNIKNRYRRGKDGGTEDLNGVYSE